MSARNVAKGREAENAVAAVLRAAGMPYAERRAKRGGMVAVDCASCGGCGHHSMAGPDCGECGGIGAVQVPADAGDITGIPGVVVQVKWSGYRPLAVDMQRTEEQRQAAGADVGVLVRKRPGVGLARAAEWDAYLPTWQVAQLLGVTEQAALQTVRNDVWRTNLESVARLLAHAGYGVPIPMV